MAGTLDKAMGDWASMTPKGASQAAALMLQPVMAATVMSAAGLAVCSQIAGVWADTLANVADAVHSPALPRAAEKKPVLSVVASSGVSQGRKTRSSSDKGRGAKEKASSGELN